MKIESQLHLGTTGVSVLQMLDLAYIFRKIYCFLDLAYFINIEVLRLSQNVQVLDQQNLNHNCI